MTFTDLKGKVKDYCNLTSTEADTRVGKTINAHYRRITASLGLDAARFVTRSQSTTNGVRTVVFAEIEKIDRVLNTTDSTAIVLLQEVEVHALRSTQPSAGAPTQWAFQNADADSAMILLDTVPQVVYSLQADGWTTLADLTGTDEPAFPESYHDVLVWFTISEELLKKEKDKLAATYAQKATNLLSELRFFLADSPTRDTVQGSSIAIPGGTGSSGGGGSVGGTAYTQTALLTFDLDPAAPFAVTSGSAKVDNLDADKLDGFDESAFAKLADNETIAGTWAFPNTGLTIKDTDASHVLSIVPGSNLTAARTLTITTGDAARTLTLSGNPTLNDWFDQSVKVAATPTFGATTITGPVTISGASAGQIVFPSTQNPSSNANTLDHYGEGIDAWTPVLGGAGGTSGQTYSVQKGWYLKIGRFVLCGFKVTLTAKGTITGNCQIQGLPFTVGTTSNSIFAGAVRWVALATNWVNITANPLSATTAADLQGANAAAATSETALVTADIQNTTQLAGTLAYIASA